MCYSKCMNKDVIYIEPEDDITDILTKLQKASQKVVALVPPQKNSVLRSAVNVKLINRAARDSSKAAVFVTTDPAIIKLAAASQIPVAKDLRSRPEVPTADDVEGAQKKEEVIQEEPVDDSAKSEDDKDKKDDKNKSDAKKDGKNGKGKKGKKGKKVPSINKTRRIIIISVIAGVLLLGFVIWAIFIAPAVKIVLTVRTTSGNFSESASFVTTESSADIDKGRFYLDQKKFEQPTSVKFQASGQQDKGNKASGSLTIYSTFHNAGSITVPTGGTFVYNGMSYAANSSATLSWNGDDSQCDAGSSIISGCRKHTSVNVTATEPGTKYNLDAKDGGWVANIGDISVANSSAMSGGTSNVVTVVEQSDVDKARSSLESANNEEAKATLSKQFSDKDQIINESFSADTPNPISKPGVGEEVPGGTQPTLSSTATFMLSGIKKDDLAKFIKKKGNLGEDQKVYDLGNPIFDRFAESSAGMYSARIKTNYHYGPEVSEDSIRDKARGKKFGDIKSALNSVNGVKDVEFQPSVFWVFSVPDDDNKIQIEIKIEDAQ